VISFASAHRVRFRTMDLERDERYFPHCSQVLKRRTYYDHRKQFYDEDRNTWVKKMRVRDDVGIDADEFIQINLPPELEVIPKASD